MTFFLDENFPKKATKLLQQRGCEIIDIRGTDEEGIDDIEIFNLCKSNKAIFLTTDKDFFHTIHLTEKPHFGIIVVAIKNPNANRILNKLEWFLNNVDYSQINDACYLILDNQCKIYR